MGGSLSYQIVAQTWDAALRAGMDAVISASLSAAVPILRWLLVIYIIVGFALVAASAMTVNAFMARIVRACIVIFVISGSGVYVQHIRDVAYDGIPNQIAAVTTGSALPITAAQQFDRVSSQADALIADVNTRNTAWTVGAVGIAVGSWLADAGIQAANAVIFGVWLFGRMLLAIVLCYGPWLLVFELFDRTRGWVDQWIGKIVGLLVFQLASSTLLQILLRGLMTILMGAHTANLGVAEAVGVLFHAAGLFLASALGMLALPMVCAIGSGAAAGNAAATLFAFRTIGSAGRLLGSTGGAGPSRAARAPQNVLARG